jgi:hypothetical protein
MEAHPLDEILARYLAERGFEDARDAIHALGPEAMRQVLASALDERWHEALGLLVMCLSDVVYPPALPHLRRWMDHPDVEGIALAAASALDRAAGKIFDVDRFWSCGHHELPATLRALGAWWDEGNARVPSEAEWLAERQRQRAALIAAEPPASPALTSPERDEIDPALVEMVNAFLELDPARQHRIGREAIVRVLPIYGATFSDLTLAMDGLAAADRIAAGADGAADAALRDRLAKHIEAADALAAYNPIHKRYQDPRAHAAAQVAQGILYLCIGSWLQGLHYARNAIEYSGQGAAAVRAELDRQRARIAASRG